MGRQPRRTDWHREVFIIMENNKTNRKANVFVMAFLTAVMTAAVVLSGVGVIGASAESLSAPDGYVEIPNTFAIGNNVNNVSHKDLGRLFMKTGVPETIYCLFVPNKSPLSDYEYESFAMAGGGQSSFITDIEGYVGYSFVYSGGTVSFTYNLVRKTVPLPEDPVKEGHHFVGWYYDAAFTRPYDGEPIYSDTSLYAKLEKNVYTVTFNSYGGTAVGEQRVAWNTAVSVPTPVREGYTFLGWYYENGTKYEGQAITADTTLIAEWAIQTFSVTFYLGDTVFETLTVEYGTSFQDVMAANERLFFMNLLNEEGVKISKSAKVTCDVSVPVGNMTNEEKVAAWIGNNLWALYLAGGLVLAGVAATVIASVVAHKRK